MYSILFHIGPVPIRAYGLMLWIGVVLALIITIRASRRTNIKPEQVVDVVLYSLIAGVVTAHVASIFLDISYYWRNPSEILQLWRSVFSSTGGLQGLSFHGGLIGGIGAAYIYTRLKRISFVAMADLCAPGLALGYAITRIGCFLNGCCYGIPTALPWGVHFHGSSIPSHPTQLYAAGISLLMVIALLAVQRRRRFTGQVFLSYLMMYSGYRFLVEFLRRGVTADVAFAGITEAQLVSLLVLAVTVPLFWTRYRRAKPEDSTCIPSEPVPAHASKSKAQNLRGG